MHRKRLTKNEIENIYNNKAQYENLNNEGKILFHVINFRQTSADESLDFLLNTVDYDIKTFKKQEKYYVRGMDEEDIAQECRYMLLKAIEHYDPFRGHDFVNYCRMLFKGRLITLLKESLFYKNIPLNFSASIHESIYTDGEGNSLTYEEIIPIGSMTFLDELCEIESIKILEDKLNNNLSDLESNAFSLYNKRYTYAEISEQLKITKKSVGNAIQRVKTKIPSIFQEERYEAKKRELAKKKGNNTIKKNIKDKKNKPKK